MNSEDFDWVSLWYIAARERGINDICTVARLDTGTGELECHRFSHAQMDGVGALGQLLRDRGYPLDQLPQTKFVVPPPLHKRPLILWRAIREAGPQQIDWLDRDPSRQGDPNTLDFLTFTVAETDRIRGRAKALGVSTNALMLESVNRIVVPQVTRGDGKGKWVFPVNLRGAVTKSRDTANHSTAIAISADRTTTAKDIDVQIRANLKAGAHWAAWWLLNIGRLIGLRGVRFLSRASEKKSHWLGTFSNMGEWNMPNLRDPAINSNEVWMAAPPGTKNYPISVACLTWNGRLAITMKIHPSINPDTNAAKLYLEMLRCELLAQGR